LTRFQKSKIYKYAFSGGQPTVEEQRERGGDPDVDVSYQYLTFFLEDDTELENIKVAYRSGILLTGDLKAKCIAEVQSYVSAFQERRDKITEEDIDHIMSPRPLEWKGNPKPKISEDGVKDAEVREEAEGMTKNQRKKLEKQRMIVEKKAAAKASAAKTEPGLETSFLTKSL